VSNKKAGNREVKARQPGPRGGFLDADRLRAISVPEVNWVFVNARIGDKNSPTIESEKEQKLQGGTDRPITSSHIARGRGTLKISQLSSKIRTGRKNVIAVHPGLYARVLGKGVQGNHIVGNDRRLRSLHSLRTEKGRSTDQ